MRDENIQTGVRDVNFTFRWYRPAPCNSSWPSINVVEMKCTVDSEGAVDDSTIESTLFDIITFFSPLCVSNKIKISKRRSIIFVLVSNIIDFRGFASELQ